MPISLALVAGDWLSLMGQDASALVRYRKKHELYKIVAAYLPPTKDSGVTRGSGSNEHSSHHERYIDVS